MRCLKLSLVVTAASLTLALAAAPASAFPGQGKLRKAWRGSKKAAHWVEKKVESGKNQQRAHERGH